MSKRVMLQCAATSLYKVQGHHRGQTDVENKVICRMNNAVCQHG